MARLRPKERPELLKAREDAEHFVKDSDRLGMSQTPKNKIIRYRQ